MPGPHDPLDAHVRAMRLEASGVLGLELAPCPGTAFPPAEPGAHVDLHLPGGLVRSYSLLPGPAGCYRLAVLRDRASRGGSRYIHERLRVGERLALSPPRNRFRLDEQAAHSVLIAGGIGITPLLGMYRRLSELGRTVQLFYCARSEAEMAFRDDLPEQPGRVRWHLDELEGGAPDLRAILAAGPADADYYCCGPAPMIAAFEQHAAELGRLRTHVERFAAEPGPTEPAGGAFEVELARSGRRLAVPAGASILQVLLAAGVDVDYSCQEGSCGACETRVLEGRPEHRDGVLSKAEREAGATMMICVSGCRGERLVLDL